MIYVKRQGMARSLYLDNNVDLGENLIQGGDMDTHSTPMRIGFIFLALCVMGFLSLLVSVPAWAQVVDATVSGTVTDTTGAVIPKAQLSITNMATGVTNTATANGGGFYTAPNLPPGSYTITATAPGFSTEVQSGLTLEVGANRTLNITLRVGSSTEKVEIVASAPNVELSSSSIG